MNGVTFCHDCWEDLLESEEVIQCEECDGNMFADSSFTLTYGCIDVNLCMQCYHRSKEEYGEEEESEESEEYQGLIHYTQFG